MIVALIPVMPDLEPRGGAAGNIGHAGCSGTALDREFEMKGAALAVMLTLVGAFALAQPAPCRCLRQGGVSSRMRRTQRGCGCSQAIRIPRQRCGGSRAKRGGCSRTPRRGCGQAVLSRPAHHEISIPLPASSPTALIEPRIGDPVAVLT
jgi:hypothetical protein